MNLDEKFALNERFPIRLSMLKFSIKKNLEYTKNLLKKDGRKTRQAKIVLGIVEEDLEDLSYYYSKKQTTSQGKCLPRS